MSRCVAAIGGGVGICRNGFPQNTACHKEHKCCSCGNPTKSVPSCLKEDWTEVGFKAWFNEDGSPKHYRGLR